MRIFGFLMRAGFVNIVSLAVAQIFNAITPLILFPKILAVLGPESYADFVFAESMSVFALTLVLFGFEISGVKLIGQAHARGDQTAIRESFSDIFTTRLTIFSICLVVVLAWCFKTSSEVPVTLLCWLLVPFGYVLQSGFYFLGRQHNLPIAVFTAISRTGLLLFLLLSIDPSWPTFLPALVIGTSYVISGAACFTLALHEIGWAFQRPSLKRVTTLVRESFNVFLSNVYVLGLKDTPIIYLGLLNFSAEAISSYSLAEKGLKALQAALRPLNQHYFSSAIKSLDVSDSPSPKTLRKLFDNVYPQIAVAVVIIIFMVGGWGLLGDKAASMFQLEERIEIASVLLAIMLPTAIFGVFNFMVGFAGLSSLGAAGTMAKLVAVAAACSAVSFLGLTTFFGIKGAAVNVILSEVLLGILILRVYFASEAFTRRK